MFFSFLLQYDIITKRLLIIILHGPIWVGISAKSTYLWRSLYKEKSTYSSTLSKRGKRLFCILEYWEHLYLCICICVFVFVFVQTGKNHHQRRYCILGYWEHVRPVPSVPRNSNGKDKIMSLALNLKTIIVNVTFWIYVTGWKKTQFGMIRMEW